MMRFTFAACLLASVSAFQAAGPLPLRNSVARAASPVAQFGFGNYGGETGKDNGYDESGNANFFLSPIAGGSKEYPYGEFEMDQSGELPAKLLAFLIVVGLPVAFAVGR